MSIHLNSACKVNLLLNILGRRPDGFHDLETVFQPIALCDSLELSPLPQGIQLTCDHPDLPVDSSNLIHRAADKFLQTTRLAGGVRIHLKKNIPLAAGLGGGSGNAATTLMGLNQLFGNPLAPAQLHELAAALGSDVPFFLQSQPALGLGRGEILEPLPPFRALQGAWILLVHPGFGVSTAWAYQRLAQFPAALNGRPGRARELVTLLQTSDLVTAGKAFYNSLEAPVLEKYPLLRMFQDFLRAQGAAAAIMSGSGSTTFALAASQSAAEKLQTQFQAQFGKTHWTALVPVG